MTRRTLYTPASWRPWALGVVGLGLVALWAQPRGLLAAPGGAGAPAPAGSPEAQDAHDQGTSDQASADVSSSKLPRVHLVPIGRAGSNVSSVIPGRIHARLRVDLGSEQSIEVLPPLEQAKPGVGGSIYREAPKPEPDHREAASRSLEQGKEAYKAGRYADAQKRLLEAVQKLEQSAAHVDNVDLVASAFGYLGLTLLRLGQKALGAEAIETAYAISPTLKLEKLPLPPRVRQQVLVAGRRALKRRKGTLEVVVDPPGAWVFVDGDEKGKAPLVQGNVLPGRHYVSARMEGRISRSTVALVTSGATTKVSLTLPDAAPRFASAAGLAAAFQAELMRRLDTGLVDRQIKPLAAQLASRVKADYILLGATERSREGGYLLRTWLFRGQDQKLVELDSFAFDGELLNLAAGTRRVSNTMAQALVSFPEARDITFVSRPRLKPGQTDPGGSGDMVGVVPGQGPTDVHSTRKPWYLRWSFWGAVIGVAVAGSLAGAGVGIYKATHRETSGTRVMVEVP